jgi:predicted Ser/Thr protein kinase
MLGRYEIVREVGRGAMGVVYLARQTDLDRVVALKELGAVLAADPAFAERFVRESRIAGSLSHPNIVTVHDYFEHDGTPYIAMEYVEGGSLRPLVGRLTLAQIVGVLECVLAGLAHAESRGVVHRDLKPENVMVTGEGAYKIADFGIAKAINQAASGRMQTATGAVMGTPAYMAPEQALAHGIGPWTDLYSTGVIAYELLLGRLPFDDTDTPMAVLLRHIREPIPPPRSINPDLDDGLDAWLNRMLAKAPEERTPSAAEAWEELEEIVIGILGPRWRRDARAGKRRKANGAPAPTTRAAAPQVTPATAPLPVAPAPTTRPHPPAPPTEARAGDADAVGEPSMPPAVLTPTTLSPPERSEPRRPRRVVLGALAGGIAVAAVAAGVALAVLPGDDTPTDDDSRVTTTSPPPPPAAARPIAETIAIGKTGRRVTTSIGFSGAALDPERIVVSDRTIADGNASFAVWQRDVGTRVGRRSAHGATVQVSGKPSRLIVALTAEPGAFDEMSAPSVVGGKSIEVSLVAPPPPPPPPSPTPTPPPSPSPTPPPAPPPPPPPPPIIG